MTKVVLCPRNLQTRTITRLSIHLLWIVPKSIIPMKTCWGKRKTPQVQESVTPLQRFFHLQAPSLKTVKELLSIKTGRIIFRLIVIRVGSFWRSILWIRRTLSRLCWKTTKVALKKGNRKILVVVVRLKNQFHRFCQKIIGTLRSEIRTTLINTTHIKCHHPTPYH